ncbi:MAG: penicillin acylase family protein [Deltaproteobacteria bacterium]|nr:penicillin acylase family protein [Deltaproteobacteria bacterium]
MIFEKPARLFTAVAIGSLAAVPLTLAGCPSDPVTDTGVGIDSPSTEDAPVEAGSCLGDIDADESLSIPGLDGPIEVVHDDRGVPHIYGTTVHDVIMVQSYLMARDRFGQMDFIRRNVLGRLSEVAGALSEDLPQTDFESRVAGYARMGRAIYDSLPATSRTRMQADAFAEGVNAYIAAIDAGTEDPRVEGGDLVTLLTTPAVDRVWLGSDIFAMARFQAASLSFDAGADVDRTTLLAQARATFPEGDPRASIYRDLFDDTPARPVYSRDGFNDGTSMALRRPDRARADRPASVIAPLATLRGAHDFLAHTEAMFERLGFGDESRGSNNWLVAGTHTASGNPIMSNDPHLSLISPAVWWYVHLNTAKMGGEDMMDVEGVAFAGLPGVVLGFNRDIAWGATTTGYDVTDVYLEQITAGTGGGPDTVAFDTDGDGDLEQVPIVVQDEIIVVSGADTTRQIEYVTTHGPAGTLSPILPGSRQPVDGMPGRFTALSVRYTGYEVSDELAYFAGLATATNVAEATAAQDAFRVGAQNFIVADRTSIGWSTEARIPTRPDEATDLAYDADGTMTGECPIFVLPGQGDHEWGADLDSRFVPHDRDPARGWIATANQDNVGVTDDGNPCNDAHYIGGDFDLGWREERIQSDLQELVTRGDITTADMIRVQAESRSAMGSQLAAGWAAILDDAMTHVPTLTTAEQADVETARTRLLAWTSFETPEATTSTDAAVIADSIATTIFNGILTRIGPIGLGDEATAMGRGSFSTSRVARFVEDSFAGTTEQQDRLEIYWDDLSTEGTTETKEQALVRATVAAFAFLRTTLGEDISTWRWGRLHTVRFESVLPTLGTDILSIPRDGDATYPNGFPRHGDYGSVDPGQYGLWNTSSFRFGSGASQRLVVEVTPDGPIAFNALPGGQSIDPNSPHKMDEALLWIRNEQPRLAFQESEIRAAADRCVVIRPR